MSYDEYKEKLDKEQDELRRRIILIESMFDMELTIEEFDKLADYYYYSLNDAERNIN